MLEKIVVVLASVSVALSVSDRSKCQDTPIPCYVCDSDSSHKACKDPFNLTAVKPDRPPLMDCVGCCVKMYSANGTITRTCTSLLPKPLFSDDVGCRNVTYQKSVFNICYCRDDVCNGAGGPKRSFHALIAATAMIAFAAFNRL